MRQDLSPSRLTIAMWDYSWLHAHYPGGSYENFDKVTDELLERGFNTVRIETFPWIIGQQSNIDQVTTIKGDPTATWGATDKDREHMVARELLEFMHLTKQKGIKVILSTWARTCLEYPNKTESLFKEVWEKTLDLLKEHNLLEHVLYIDVDQEFPYFSVYRDKLNSFGDDAQAQQLTNDVDAMEAAGQRKSSRRPGFNEAQLDYLNDLFADSMKFFQSKYPQQRFTFSFTGFWNEYRKLNLKMFDVLELHFWSHGPKWDNRTRFGDITKDLGDNDYGDYQDRIDAVLSTQRPMVMHEMHRRLETAIAWGEEISAPVVNTESWGPWWHRDHPQLRWQWLQDWCKDCNTLAGDYGLWGSTPWNFCHPYWSTWQDTSWYQDVNNAFLRSTRTRQPLPIVSNRTMF